MLQRLLALQVILMKKMKIELKQVQWKIRESLGKSKALLMNENEKCYNMLRLLAFIEF
jgi:hypothetical protein